MKRSEGVGAAHGTDSLYCTGIHPYPFHAAAVRYCMLRHDGFALQTGSTQTVRTATHGRASCLIQYIDFRSCHRMLGFTSRSHIASIAGASRSPGIRIAMELTQKLSCRSTLVTTPSLRRQKSVIARLHARS